MGGVTAGFSIVSLSGIVGPLPCRDSGSIEDEAISQRLTVRSCRGCGARGVGDRSWGLDGTLLWGLSPPGFIGRLAGLKVLVLCFTSNPFHPGK